MRDRWSAAARDALARPRARRRGRGGASTPRCSRSSGWGPTPPPSTPPPSTATASSRAIAAAPPTTCSTTGPDSPARVDVASEHVVTQAADRRVARGRRAAARSGPARAGPRRRPARQVSELMSPLCWDLAHIGHYEELWLVRELDRRGAHRTARYDDVYDAFKHPRRDRAALDILDAAGAREFDADGARPRARRCSTRSTLDAAIRCSPTASSTGWSCSTSTSTTRRCSRPSSSWTTSRIPAPTAPVDAARTSRASTASAHDVLIPGGEHVLGTDADPGRTTTNVPRTWSARPVPHRHHRGHQRCLRRVRRGRRLRRPAHWTDAGWAWRADAGLVAPQYWALST